MDEGAKQLLDTVKIGVMATVMEDGSPHATPLHFAPMGDDAIVWVSNANSRHSQNAMRTGQVDFVVWTEQRRAVYLHTTAVVAEGEKREKALQFYKEKLGDFLPNIDDLTVYLSPIGKLDENSTTQYMWHFVA